MASPETSDWLGPIEITWSDSVDMPNIPIHCKYMGEWFVLKSIAHGSKCPIEFWLPIDVGQKFSWFMKTCSEFSLPLQDAANEVVQICIFLLPKIVNCERAQAQSWLEAYSWMGRPSLQRIPTFPWQLGSLWKFSPCQATWPEIACGQGTEHLVVQAGQVWGKKWLRMWIVIRSDNET